MKYGGLEEVGFVVKSTLLPRESSCFLGKSGLSIGSKAYSIYPKVYCICAVKYPVLKSIFLRLKPLFYPKKAQVPTKLRCNFLHFEDTLQWFALIPYWHRISPRSHVKKEFRLAFFLVPMS